MSDITKQSPEIMREMLKKRFPDMDESHIDAQLAGKRWPLEDPSWLTEVKKLNTKKPAGERFNNGKVRYDLLEPFAIEQVARIFTKGAAKYAPHNWLKGMEWSKMIASMKRHLAAFERGEDYDYDPKCETCQSGNCVNHTGELHIAQVAWNALGLTSFYKYFPQGDDRLSHVIAKPKIGLDIDEVICDWVGHWCKHHQQELPAFWTFDRQLAAKFKALENDKEFWLSIPPKRLPSELPFEPHCYITSRSIPVEWTEEWLDRHGFPHVPVYVVPLGASKVEVAKKSGIDQFIDDRYENFVELNNAGICTFLMDAKHNQRYDVGYRRIKDFKDFKERFMW